jgi:hypothetical protein
VDFFTTDVLRTSFLPFIFTFTNELLVLPPSLAAIKSFASTTVIVKVPGSPEISMYRGIKKINSYSKYENIFYCSNYYLQVDLCYT